MCKWTSKYKQTQMGPWIQHVILAQGKGKQAISVGFFSPFSSAVFCELAQGITKRQVELRNLNLGWWYTEGNQQDPKKGHMECIHEDDCSPEMQDRAREKQGWHSGRTESVIHWHSACRRQCQEWLYFLGGHRSRRWCGTSEAADSSPGHLNCAGTPDSQGKMHMKHHSMKSRHTRGVMLGMLRHSCDGCWWSGSRGAQSEHWVHVEDRAPLPGCRRNRYLWQE